ncbi:hypothetical protein DEO72_LG1g2847 [Vigna unguiculata]|uniref:Uncharacterized protein n=1 Tax=Vigna unguiculata TaxID=3917 RepID=A0A4D6KNH2_VIGUN|nr:hypothetical protein DEO72_LG1g2847 [Vigna unguiculata]
MNTDELPAADKEEVVMLMKFTDRLPTKGLVRVYNSIHPIIDIEGHMAQVGKKNLTLFQALRKEKAGLSSGAKGPKAGLIELPETTVRKDIEIDMPEILINSINNMEPDNLVRMVVEFNSKALILGHRVGSLYRREVKEGNREKLEELQEEKFKGKIADLEADYDELKEKHEGTTFFCKEVDMANPRFDVNKDVVDGQLINKAESNPEEEVEKAMADEDVNAGAARQGQGLSSGAKGPKAGLIELPETPVRKDIEIDMPEILINSINNMEPDNLVRMVVEFNSKALILGHRVGSLYRREVKEGNREKLEERQEEKFKGKIADLEADYDELKEKHEGVEVELEVLISCRIQEEINGCEEGVGQTTFFCKEVDMASPRFDVNKDVEDGQRINKAESNPEEEVEKAMADEDVNAGAAVVYSEDNLFLGDKNQQKTRYWCGVWWQGVISKGVLATRGDWWQGVIRQAIDSKTMGLEWIWRLATRMFRQAVCVVFSPGHA